MLAEFAALSAGPVEVGARVKLRSAGPLVFYGKVIWIDWTAERASAAWHDGMTTTVSSRDLLGCRIYEGI